MRKISLNVFFVLLIGLGLAAAQTYPSGRALRGATIPAGTSLSIRTNEAINAQHPQVGTTYTAEISQDVLGSNGQVLIPRGSPAALMVADTGKSITGKEEMGLVLQSVTVNGNTYNVTSNSEAGSKNGGLGANKRTGEYVGGGALLGTVIGAVAGGAKGAVIGAVAGAGAGAGTQVLTRGNQIKVPAESVLTFKLDQPLTLH